jgi:DNA-binding transcriptional regulator YiaG
MPDDQNWQLQRDMTPLEFSTAIKGLKLSKAAAGRYLGVAARTVSRYTEGQTRIPASCVLLLRAAMIYGFAPLVPSWKSDPNKRW